MKCKSLNVVKLAACIILVVGLRVGAMASCGDSLSAIAAGVASAKNLPPQVQQDPQSSGHTPDNPTIVGLWHVLFKVDGQVTQEAYQLWNAGGTEVHNPNVDPRGGNVCLGVWIASNGTFELAHRVWNYDTTGDFLGTIHLSEKITLSTDGNTQGGLFRLDFFDPSGNFLMSVHGNVVGRRISVD
jgi:hypothetical protein